jgi:hypothetical protein
MKVVALSAGDWDGTGYLALSFIDRLLGVWRVPAESTVVLPVRSVHSFGRREPLHVVGVDSSMSVISSKTLAPNRITFIAGARWIIEMPASEQPPSPGDDVVFAHV